MPVEQHPPQNSRPISHRSGFRTLGRANRARARTHTHTHKHKVQNIYLAPGLLAQHAPQSSHPTHLLPGVPPRSRPPGSIRLASNGPSLRVRA